MKKILAAALSVAVLAISPDRLFRRRIILRRARGVNPTGSLHGGRSRRSIRRLPSQKSHPDLPVRCWRRNGPELPDDGPLSGEASGGSR